MRDMRRYASRLGLGFFTVGPSNSLLKPQTLIMGLKPLHRLNLSLWQWSLSGVGKNGGGLIVIRNKTFLVAELWLATPLSPDP